MSLLSLPKATLILPHDDANPLKSRSHSYLRNPGTLKMGLDPLLYLLHRPRPCPRPRPRSHIPRLKATLLLLRAVTVYVLRQHLILGINRKRSSLSITILYGRSNGLKSIEIHPKNTVPADINLKSIHLRVTG